MARTLITATVTSTAGNFLHVGSDTAGDVANGNEFDNDGDVFLAVRNADGATPHFISFACPKIIDGQAVTNFTPASIAANAIRWFGPFRTSLYNQANGRVGFNVDDAQIFVQVIRIPEVN